MAEDDDSEVDPAIAEAMGFSGFGMQPGKKRKLNADMAFIDSKAMNSQSQSKARETFKNDRGQQKPATPQEASQPAPTGEVKPGQTSTPTTGPTIIDTATPSDIDGNDEQSLRALANGVRNKNGDMVYFMPNFLEDPWRNLEPR